MKISKIALSIFLLATMASCESKIDVVSNKESDYRIIIPQNATPFETKAAEDLQKYISQLTNTEVPIKNDDMNPAECEILVGNTNRKIDFSSQDLKKLQKKDSYLIQTENKKIVLKGDQGKGIIYAVEDLVEQWGYEYYTIDTQVIPHKETLSVSNKLHKIEVPALAFRTTNIRYTNNTSYANWMRIEKREDAWQPSWSVHTSLRYVSADKYYENHPEYFALVGGKRRPNTQLCLSNPNVLNIVVDSIKSMQQRAINKTLCWDFSQNDTGGWCECSECAKINKDTQAPSGSVITFMNKLAKKLPEVNFSTLAYQYTRKAPQNLTVDPRTRITFCSIECNRNLPLTKDSKSKSFCKDMQDWGKLSNNLFVWDYMTDFHNLMAPFPNLRVLKPNIQFFVNNGAQGLFEQGGGYTEMDEMKTFLVSKLMWNPDLNADSLMNKFSEAYYGVEASKYMMEYVKITHDELEKSGEDLYIYGHPSKHIQGFLSRENINKYLDLFAKAEEAAKENPIHLEHLLLSKVPVLYASIETAKGGGLSEKGCFQVENKQISVKPEIESQLNEFMKLCSKFNIKALHEKGLTPDAYFEETSHYLKKGAVHHLALNKNIEVQNSVSNKFCSKNQLVDGIRGTGEFKFNWVGVEENDLIATVDLGGETSIHSIEIDFLHYINEWIFAPKQVSFLISDDNVKYRKISTLKPINLDIKSKERIISPFVVKSLKNIKGRYVKVVAESQRKVPNWHLGANGKAWTFADEIIIN